MRGKKGSDEQDAYPTSPMSYLLFGTVLLGAWSLLRNLGNERERRQYLLEWRLNREAEERQREKPRSGKPV